MKKKFLLSVTCIAVLSACTGNPQTASSGFEYLEQKAAPKLSYPANLDKPKQIINYEIPAIKKSNQLLGKDVHITPPAQVLTQVEGSIRPQDILRATIEFDTSTQKKFAEQIWSSTQKWLKANSVETIIFQNNQLKTNWHTASIQKPSKIFFGLEDVFVTRANIETKAKYVINLVPSPSGRTANLNVSVTDYEQAKGTEIITTTPSQLERDNVAVKALNNIVAQYQKDLTELKSSANSKAIQELSFKLQPENTILVNASFERAWQLISTVLTEVGFKVEYADKAQATYFVQMPSAGLMGLLGMRENLLDSGDYKLLLEDKVQNTSIEIYDEDGKVLTKEQAQRLVNAMQQSLLAPENK